MKQGFSKSKNVTERAPYTRRTDIGIINSNMLGAVANALVFIKSKSEMTSAAHDTVYDFLSREARDRWDILRPLI